MQMRRYFLTVGDKNPIMFNDMLCEYCAVEIGPLHGGGREGCLQVVFLSQLAHCLLGAPGQTLKLSSPQTPPGLFFRHGASQ